MVNKKKNKARQQGPDEQNASDSTESCEETQNAGGKCPHVAKAVDFLRVKKFLKSSGIAQECMDCSVKPVAFGPELEHIDMKVEGNPGLWLCLKCGHQSCGRDENQHALKHYQTPRSDLHALVVNTELWNVWCYDCNLEIPAMRIKKLHECLEFIKRQEDAPVKLKKPVISTMIQEKEESPGKNASNAIVHNTTASKDLPRVRGLRNNGNTCFFNAVLQCLAHTPFLLNVLQELREPGEKFSLPGNKPSDEAEEDDTHLPPIEGELSKWGALTETLATTLSELQSSNPDVYNPAPLMRVLLSRCPLFEGGDQHDSQELLRHLLEGVRSEDLKRYQTAILHHLGLKVNVVPSTVNEELKKKVKEYGKQASELSLCPDQVFRGSLVSTLECQDCLHASQRAETFMDLSLPVMADKPQPPAMRRKSSEDSVDFCGKSTNNQPSKHQLKKEKKMARKGKKRQGSKNRVSESGEGGEPTIDEEAVDANASNESEQSDADVEDNLDQDAMPKKDVGESGYSSEKAANEDSSSPISHVVNGDSALASPASPALRHSPIPLPYGDFYPNLNQETLYQCSDLPERPTNSPVCRNPLFDAQDTSMKQFDFMNHSYSTFPPDEELAISIPALESMSSVSPVSSEVNLDLASPQGAASSPVQDFDRPISRFAFNAEQRGEVMVFDSETCFSSGHVPSSQRVYFAQCFPVKHMDLEHVVEVPQVKVDEVDGPILDLDVPLMQIGDTDGPILVDSEVFEVPKVQIDDVDGPTLDLDVPEVQIDDVDGPILDLEVPEVQIDDVDGPILVDSEVFEVPKVQIDDVDGPILDLDVSEVQIDDVNGPILVDSEVFEVPKVQIDDVDGPVLDLDVPEVQIDDVDGPILVDSEVFEVPKIQIDDVDGPILDLDVPEVQIDDVDGPILVDSEVFEIPKVQIDDVDGPILDFDVPDVQIDDIDGPIMDLVDADDNMVMWKIYDGNDEKVKTLHLEHVMKQMSLKESTSQDILAGISEEEVNHLIKELSKDELNRELDKEEVHMTGQESGDVMFGPLMESCYDMKIVQAGDSSPMKERRRPELMSYSSTLSPKYMADDGECSIMSCLNQFTSVELMTGNNKVGCEACTQRQNQGNKEGKMVTTNSTKQFLVSSPPPVLILHLKRFQLQRSLLKKMARHVSFPRVLDLAPLISTKSKDSATVSSSQSKVLYSLYGIVEHSGTLQYGHYIAYVKVRAPVTCNDPQWRFLRQGSEVKSDGLEPTPPPGKWYCVSDARVNEVSEEKVMRAEAYLLFYERIL